MVGSNDKILLFLMMIFYIIKCDYSMTISISSPMLNFS